MPLPSRTTRSFWRMYRSLPPDIKRAAQDAYRQWRADPRARGLRFKKVSGRDNLYSARITDDWRALAIWRDGAFFWFWIGTHDAYARILKSM